MRAVGYCQAHYDTLRGWWKAWNLPITPERYLSQDGIVVLDGDKAVVAGFLYKLGTTPLFWIEGIVSNREEAAEVRKKAIELLLQSLSLLAKERGCELLMGSTPRSSLASAFQAEGFRPAPEKYWHLGRAL